MINETLQIFWRVSKCQQPVSLRKTRSYYDVPIGQQRDCHKQPLRGNLNRIWSSSITKDKGVQKKPWLFTIYTEKPARHRFVQMITKMPDGKFRSDNHFSTQKVSIYRKRLGRVQPYHSEELQMEYIFH